jgi:hypothetical protein
LEALHSFESSSSVSLESTRQKDNIRILVPSISNHY